MMTVMENLPFLTQNQNEPSSRNEQHDWPEVPPPRRFIAQNPEKTDVFESLKNVNPVALILIGIVIGTLIVSMRPIVVQSAKSI
jgi:hypothetical protein